MATLYNNNWPHGFRPLMEDTAGAPVGVKQYAKPSTDANTIFQFDAVRKLAGSAAVEGQMLPTPVCQTYATGTPGTTLFLGASLNYGAPNANTVQLIVDDPYAIFDGQMDGTTAITVASFAGKNANVNNAAQTNGARLSAMQLSTASVATTAGEDVRILDLSRNIVNTENPNALVEFIFLKHQYAQGSAGV